MSEENVKSLTPFDDDAFVETLPTQNATETVPQGNETVEAPSTETAPKVEEPTAVPQVDYNTYWKEQFGFDSEEVAKEQIQRWKEMKPAEEVKFENDESKKLYESVLKGDKKQVLSILAKQEALENLTSAEVNENTASDIVKMAMMQKYPTLTKEQIDYKFNKQFAIPSEPKQYADELDSEYEQRLNVWKNNVNDIKQDLLIEANISKPELEKIKSDLKLPDIFQNNEQIAEPTPQELAEYKAIVQKNIQSVSTALKSYKGLDVTVKDGEVEIPVSYNLSDDEKGQVQSILSSAIEKNNVNSFIGSRWFDKEGNPNTAQAIKDITLLLFGDKAVQKVANESAAKRMEAKIKADSNISLGKNPQGTFNPQNANEEALKNQFDAIWDA